MDSEISSPQLVIFRGQRRFKGVLGFGQAVHKGDNGDDGMAHNHVSPIS